MQKPSLAISHASISSMGYYNDCSKKWEFKYIYKLPERTILGMKIGSTNHAILESVNTWIKYKKTEPDKAYFLNEIEHLTKVSFPLEIFAKEKRGSKAEHELSEEEFCVKQRLEILEQLKKICSIYIDVASRDFKEIVLIEKDHVFDVNGTPFKMVTDAVVRFKDNSLRVIDYKTKAKSSEDVAILQLVSYGLGVKDLLKEDVDGLEQWDFIRKAEPELRIHKVDMDKFENYSNVLKEEAESFWKGVHGKLFTRNMRSMFCGPTKCDYWNVCMNPGTLEKELESVADFHKDVVDNLENRRTR